MLNYNNNIPWILVDNFAITPTGKKGEVKVQNYLPVDSVECIKADDNKTVHLVIMGMNQMGTALGVQTALMCHFPNTHRDRNLRTINTFIDDQAIKENEFLKDRFATMFELCRIRNVEIGKNQLEIKENLIQHILSEVVAGYLMPTVVVPLASTIVFQLTRMMTSESD